MRGKTGEDWMNVYVQERGGRVTFFSLFFFFAWACKEEVGRGGVDPGSADQ